MAFMMYIKTTGADKKVWPGTTTHDLSTIKVSGKALDSKEWSEVQALDYGVIATLDGKSGDPTGHRDHIPLSVRMEIDKNAANYFKSLVTGEGLNVEVVLIQNKPSKPGDKAGNVGGKQAAMHYALLDAHVHKFRNMSGDAQMQSQVGAKARGDFDTTELMEYTFAFRRITINSSPATDNVQAYDDWEDPMQGGQKA